MALQAPRGAPCAGGDGEPLRTARSRGTTRQKGSQMTRREFGYTLGAPLVAASPTGPRRLARKDSFFGIHLDLHPTDRDTALGRDVTEEMVERLLARVKPDYVQYDYKGHEGFIGYPSKVSASAPILKDSLAIWRKVTAARGVALYIHFSGVWDSQAVKEHPEWARIGPDGKPDVNQTSTFGPYVDERMIPQLREAADNYQLDGAWIDGDCWATHPDYGEAAARAFREATGIQNLPKGPQDPGWLEFLELNRAQFRKYVRRYVEELHRSHPHFQIASNWLYTTLMPEKPEIPVDFVSGDYGGNAAVSRARLEARYLAQVGKPWDLMAWGFQWNRDHPVSDVHKSAVQLMQEAAVVLAQGGGFQIYYQPTRAGKIDDRHIDVMGKVADFCRARRKWSHRTETVPEIGVVFSKETLYSRSGRLFGGWGGAIHPARGLVDALVESHHSVDVVPDWKLADVAPQYPCLVLPDWSDAGETVRDELLRYLKGGGRLLVIGADNALLFAGALGVRLAGRPSDQRAYVPGREVFANVSGRWVDVEPAGARVLETRFPTYDSTRDGRVAATVHSYGSGRVAAIYGPAGSVFAATHAPETRRFVARVLAHVFTPSFRLEGPPTVEAVRRKGDLELLHLINATSMQVASDYRAIDYVPPAGPLRVHIRMKRPPQRVSFEPGGVILRGSFRDGTWTGTLDRLDIHGVLVWEA